MIKIWGRNTSSNVQKAMWAVGELGLDHTRIDIGGAFGKNNEPAYLAMNPNGLVPTLEEEDGFLLWESNSIVRYLAGKHDKNGVLEPKDAKQRALASQWMDWQLSVVGPAITPAFWGLIRTPPEKRDAAAIKASQDKTTRCDEDARRATGQDGLRRRPGIFLRRHSGRRDGLSFSPACARPAVIAQPRALVRPDLQTQGVPRSRRQHSADVTLDLSSGIIGLDPAIHDDARQQKSFVRLYLRMRFMDARVKPGHDGENFVLQNSTTPRRAAASARRR